MQETAAKKYKFDQFTLDNYKRLLEIAQKNYEFIFFEDLNRTNGRRIILRHDLEFSPELALEMAEIEYSLGIKSTTFLNMHSEFYNLLDKETSDIVGKIISLGHQIGCHMNSHFYGIKSETQLEDYLEFEKEILQRLFNSSINSFSFHNTNSFVLEFTKAKYAGLINTYSPAYFNEIGYCADSTGFWRFENLFERLEIGDDQIMQVLIHDGMWSREILPPRQRIYSVIEQRAQKLKIYYDKSLKKFNAKNIDWDGEI
jgi:hypothetical protein